MEKYLKINRTLFLIVLFLNITTNTFGQYNANPETTSQGDSYWNNAILTMACTINNDIGNFIITKKDGGSFTSSGTMYLFAFGNGYSDYTTIADKSVSAGDYYIELSHDFDWWYNEEFPVTYYAHYSVSGNDGWAEVGPISIEPKIELPAPTVNLTSPNNGTFQVGETMRIDWTSTNQHHWEIDILKAGVQIAKILPSASDYSNTYFNWQIPATVTDGTVTHTLDGNDYQIKVVVWNSDDPEKESHDFDKSQSYLTINPELPAPTVSLTSPNNGTFQVGETMQIDWTSTHQHHWEIDILKAGVQIAKILPSASDYSNTYFNWQIPATVTDGTVTYALDGNDYQIKVVVWNSDDPEKESHDFDKSQSYLTINPELPAPTVSLTSPNNGTFQVGETMQIDWTSTYQHHWEIDILKAGVQIAKILPSASDYSNTYFNWQIPATVTDGTVIYALDGNDYQIKVVVWNSDNSEIESHDFDKSQSYLTINPLTNGNCTYLEVPEYATEAVTFLCSEGLLDDDGECEPYEPITRAALAKLAYKSINLEQNSFANDFPSPFQDLQDNTTWYYSFAKNLSYLEYQDGIAPFDKTFFNFYASNPISRAHALKVLIETWDIDVVTGTDLPFTDVEQNHDAYKYIYTAYKEGIIEDNEDHIFGADVNAYRVEIFVMLHKMMTSLGLTFPVPTKEDFFIPGNYTPENFASFNSLHSGNFNFYTKTSFAISSIGIPLGFEHTYNSYLSEMPEGLTPLKPLGKAWSHSYNTYIMEIPGDMERPDDFRAVIALPNGGFNVYKLENGTYQCETKGVYNTLQKPTPDKFTVTTKNQIIYTYQKPSSSADDFPYVLKSVHDRNGNTLTVKYERSAVESDYFRISEVIGTAGRSLTFDYHNSTDLISHITDPIRRTVYFEFDTDVAKESKLTEFKDAKGNSSRYNYGTSEAEKFLLLSIQLPKGNTITNTYENKKLTSTQTNGNQPTNYDIRQNYGQIGSLNYTSAVIKDPLGKQTTIDYDKYGNPRRIQAPTSTTDITYDATHTTKPEIIEINGKEVSYAYDDTGNVLAVNLPLGVSHQYQYNAKNDITRYTNPKGETYQYDYDTNGNVDEIVTPEGRTTTITRNTKGLATSTTNPIGITVSYSYDDYGNFESITAPEGITTKSSYDDASRMLSFTNPNNNTISYQYDDNDNLLSETLSDLVTRYGYDQNGNLTAITNAQGGVTSMKYDADNDFLDSVSFGGNTNSYTYEENGRLETYTDPKGQPFTNAYDDKGRLKSVSSGNETVTYEYDSDNNIISVTNSNGVIRFDYDDLNRVTQTTDFWGNVVKYAYDKASNITGITYPNNETVTYTYDDDNLLKNVTDWNNNKTTYTYRNDGLLTRTDYPNGTYCTYDYDNAGRMTGMGWKSNTSVINEYVFGLDPLGNHISEQKTEPYASNGLTAQTVSYSYNDANRITKAGSMSFDFDKNGNTTTNGNRHYQYDTYDRLTAVSGDFDAQYTYDGSGNCRAKTTNSIVKRYVLDLLGMTNVLVETDGSNNPQNYYVYGLGLISRIDADNQTNYYHYDFRGSTVAMTDENASITHKYQYEDYGEVLQMQEANFNPFRYVGKYGVMYEDSSLYFMRARYYDPEIGRFISEDPIWSTNLYPYAGNNPIMGIDPRGEILIELYQAYKLYNQFHDCLKQKNSSSDGGTCPDCLDPSTIGNNLLGLSYPGSNNPRTYAGDYSYAYVPKRLSEYPAIRHDRRYDNLGIAGARGLLTDTRAIGADWRFVGEELYIALNPSNDSVTRMQAFILGGGLGLATLPKTLYHLGRARLD